MLGIIKKDLFMIKNNTKLLIITLLIYVFYSIMFNMDMSFFLPFMGVMICISTFNYDDFNNFHGYAISFPNGREYIVKGKYIVTICLVIILTIFSILFSYLINTFRSIGIFNLSTLFGELFGIFFLIAVLYPFLFKYGAEKGRIVMFTIGILVICIVTLFTKVINIEISRNLVNFFYSYYIIIFIIISVLLLSVSYIISKKIYLNKEF